MTNYEKIKQMTIDEMAEFIKHCDCETSCAFEVACWYGDKDCDCNNGIKQWLESESEE